MERKISLLQALVLFLPPHVDHNRQTDDQDTTVKYKAVEYGKNKYINMIQNLMG